MKFATLTAPFLTALMFAAPMVASSAVASDLPEAAPQPVPTRSGWTFEASPYAFAPSMKGDVGVFGAPAVDVDLSFKDIFNALDWGDFPTVVMLKGELRNDRVGIFFYLLHMSLEGAGATPGPLFSSAQLNVSLWSGTALGFYRVAEDGVSHLDALAGLRVWSLDADLAFGAGISPGIGLQDDQTWVDPVVGLKGKYGLGDDFFIEGWGLIGGFGVSSKFMWDVWGALGYQVNDWFSASAGWRHIGVDYSEGAFVFDTDFDGPMIDLTVSF